MNKTQISAKIVADSINPQGDRLISILCTFPRIILAEINTHRMLSKSTSSSRAIPFNKMVESVKNDPFIPIAWQKSHSGMQGSEYFIDKEEIKYLESHWLRAMKEAVNQSKYLQGSTTGKAVTKQLCNRLLEPFMWTTMLITGSKESWDNLFELRAPIYNLNYFHEYSMGNFDGSPSEDLTFRSKKDAYKYFGNRKGIDWLKVNEGQAEIHFMELAECIWDSVNESTPKQLKAGEWHLPMLPKEAENLSLQEQLNWCVGIHANTSYTVVGDGKKITLEHSTKIHDKCKEEHHSSVFEHCCQVPTQEEYNNSFKGQEKGWFRNYKGFKSYRQVIEENKIKL